MLTPGFDARKGTVEATACAFVKKLLLLCFALLAGIVVCLSFCYGLYVRLKQGPNAAFI